MLHWHHRNKSNTDISTRISSQAQFRLLAFALQTSCLGLSAIKCHLYNWYICHRIIAEGVVSRVAIKREPKIAKHNKWVHRQGDEGNK